ncbi:hypothetical protein [Selenomonas ruminantium]|uniref:hypothetical protein n=1 Tax=Selenomonas ruminantium TaxID=971 RepID=UPI0026ECCDD7|nr:hypothetical protein [Selenomonas ruminantium]
MHKLVLSCLLTAVLTMAVVVMAFVVGTGYFVGNYAVHFGLRRGMMEKTGTVTGFGTTYVARCSVL